MESAESTVLRIRTESRRSWVNLQNALALLEGRTDAEFGTPKVEQSSRSVVNRMLRETGLGLGGLRNLIDKLASRHRR
jgi:hypothetical protein